MNILRAILVLTLLVSFGCGSVPVGQKMLTPPQKKMQAAKHWDVLAANIAEKIRKKIDENPEIAFRPVFMSSQDTSQFSSTFKLLLEYNLFKKHIRTTEVADDAIVFAYKTKTLNHNANRVAGDWAYRREMALGAAFLGTGATFGIAAAYNAVDYTTFAGVQGALIGTAIGAGALGLIDTIAYGHFTGITNTEFIFASETSVGGKVYDMYIDVYYINPEDVQQYIAQIKKTQPNETLPLQGKTFKVVGDSQRHPKK